MSTTKEQSNSVFRGPLVVSTVRAPKPCSHGVTLCGVPPFYWKTLSSRCIDTFGAELAHMVPCGDMNVSPLKALSFSVFTKEKALSKKLFLGVSPTVLLERPYGPCALFANLSGYASFYSMISVYVRWLTKCGESLGFSWPLYLGLSCLGNVSYYSERYRKWREKFALKLVSWLEGCSTSGLCTKSSDVFEAVWSGCSWEENGAWYRRPPGFMFLLRVLKPIVSKPIEDDAYIRLFSELWNRFPDLYNYCFFDCVRFFSDNVEPVVDVFVDLINRHWFGPALYLYVFHFNLYTRYNKYRLLDKYYLSLDRCSHTDLLAFIDYLFTNTPAYFFRTVDGLVELLRWLFFILRDKLPDNYKAFIDLQRIVGDNGECYPNTYFRLFVPEVQEDAFFFSLRYREDVIAQFQRCAMELARFGNVWSLFYLCSITNDLERYDKLVGGLFSDANLLRSCWSSLWLDVLGMPYYGFTLDALRMCSKLGVFPLGTGLGDGVCDPVLESLWWTSSLASSLSRVRSFLSERRCRVGDYYGDFFTKFKGLLGQYSELITYWESWFAN